MAMDYVSSQSFARRTIAAGLVAICLAPAASGAQSAPPSVPDQTQPREAAAAQAGKPSFSVASVRPNKSGGRPGGIRPLANGRLTATNVTLRELILRAYGVHDSQLVGGPAWVASDRFDVVANTETLPPGGISDVMVMLRTLLAERFALRTRSDKRTLATYVMLPAHSDGKPGPQLRVSTIDCSTNPASAVPNTASADAQGWPPCGLALIRSTVGKVRTRVEGKQSAVTMQELAANFQTTAGRPVIDRTGFVGKFDVEYAFSVENPTAGAASTTQLSDLPDIFTAFREQLGLRLDAQENPVDVLIIDTVEQPTAN
jgi:uncharacterized protein (TIGR03435 family)